MSSCLASPMRPSLPLPDRVPVQLKRMRSPSLTALAEPLKSAIKTCKRKDDGSPRSACEIVEMETAKPTTVSCMKTRSAWPQMPGCEGLRNALLLLQNSRQHAMMLMMQNHWDRAMSVLEKVENASESVCSQRRKLVLEHANSINAMATAPSSPVARKRSVRFVEDVEVVEAQEIDRTASEIQTPVREEMLVLRASRVIPRENYSELWM